MENVVIVSAQRTPVGSFQGSLSTLPATRLGAIAIKSAIEKINLSPNDIHEVIMGQVLTAGAGQAPARQAALYAGLANSTPCLTINKVCGSGLKAVMLAADGIRLGNTSVAIAGGQENMSLAPHLLENSRQGYRMGSVSMIDSMIKDGLWDPYNNFHMGNAAEICSREYSFSREDQDAFAIDSYKKAQASIANGLLKNEIAEVIIEGKKGNVTINTDEEPGKAMFDKMPGLKPAFEKDGTITAANASKINDGAAAIVLMSESEAKKRGLKPLAKILSSATFAHDPKYFTTAPVGAIKKSLDNAQLKISDIDLFEINEAFANVTMAAQRSLEIPMDRINVFGGAIAFGHPIGASGARIFTTLIHGLHTKNAKRGLATLCIGGGEAVSVIIERV
jgi:acetyl-CoA C-acetyltransferase